ncbi:MAG: T9SS type A sorting domain-containing protein [Flavobacteriales bacterium]|nr:T9SS type A sorting domain-containing protein [Flavobacteriales bacterium]
MKKLTLIIFTIVAMISISPFANGQNNVWSLPPNYKIGTVIDPLPKPTEANHIGSGFTNDPTDPEDGYDWQIPEYGHNAMQDVNGDLLFFIVDGYIYNKDGHLIFIIEQDYSYYRPELAGANELLVLPDPEDCNKYYLFGDQPVVVPGSNACYPMWGMFDLSVADPVNLGAQWIYPQSILGIMPSSPPSYHLFYRNIHHKYAATQIRTDNSRLVFINSFNALHVYKIDNNGLSFVKSLYPIGTESASEIINNRSELEIIELTNSANQKIYRTAYSFLNDDGDWVIINYDIDYNSLNIDNSTIEYTLLPTQTTPTTKEALPHGIEFSVDGNTLYFTHETNSLNTNPIEYHVIGSGNNNKQPLLVANAQDFQFTQIELDKNGEMMFVGEQSNVGNRLAKLSNTNSPSPSNWLDYSQSISYNYSIAGGSLNGNPAKKLYLLPDQIDGMNYADHFTANTECCIENTTFSTTTYSNEQSGTQTWTTSSNPFGNATTITVKDELIIKTGANITATGLRFEFAPDAKLVIEQGARFTANSCIFTVNTECENAPMWNGIEVHGPSANKQWFDAGRFIANSSTIEHSYLGVHNFATVKSGTPGVFWEDYTFKRGGVIQATNTTFKNNHRGTVFFGFQNKSILNLPINDESKFDNCIFQTSTQLNKPSLTPTVIMAHLFDVQGVNFYGCDFKNTASYAAIPYIDRGMGISANNCLITVTKKCNVVNCTNPDKGNFINLLRGIESIATSTKTTEVSYTNFYNNWRSIYLEEVDLAKITQNYVNVGADSYWGSSYGLYLNTCDGYTVENNTFNTNTTTQNGYVGVYVLNSGTENNEIYRNTFDKFYIGSQAVDVNGNGVFGSGSKGLEFRCNTYINGRDHDILISSGSINQTHGTCVSATSPSNNRFSYTTQYGDFWQVDLTKNISYQFSQPNGYNLAPRNYPIATHYNNANTFPTICGSYNFNPSTSCPDRINTGGGSSSMSFGGSSTNLMIEMEANQVVIEDLEDELAQMNTNDTTAIKEKKETIAYFKNQKEKAKNNLLQHYLLSEDVENRFEEMLPIIEKEANPHKKMRFYLAAKKFDKAQELLDKVANKKTFGSFIKLYSSLLALEQSANFDEELRTNATLLQKITELADATDDSYEKSFAKTILKRAGLRNDLETIEMINLSSARLMNHNEETQNSTFITQHSIAVFPNPTSGEVNITHNLNLENGKVNFKVYNMLGVEVLNENLTSTNNEVQLNNLKSGIYFYTITQNNQTIKTDKLMVK